MTNKRIAQIICKFKEHKPFHFIQKEAGVKFVMKACSRCNKTLNVYSLGTVPLKDLSLSEGLEKIWDDHIINIREAEQE